MSRLAPVANGQPTQGIGSVPASAARPVAILDPDAPLPVPRAHSAPSAPHPPVPAAPAAVNPRSAHSAAAATVTAAWLSLTATELEVRRYFRTLPVSSGLEMLAKMRRQCDMAAETLQQRMDEGNTERCTGCNKTLDEARKSQWIMQGSEVDSETGVPMPYRFCGPMCVRERNREKMLPPDQRNKLRFDGTEEGEIR